MANRKRLHLKLTLDPDTLALITAMANTTGKSRSQIIETVLWHSTLTQDYIHRLK